MFVSIKEAFGSETAFTKALSENKEYQQALFDEIGFVYSSEDENISITHQDAIPGGRIDNVVYYNNIPKLVIECQDTKGMLDIIHSGKIVPYMAYKNVTDGVLICEGADQVLVDMVRDRFVDRIFVLQIVIYKNKSGEIDITFKHAYRPEGIIVKTQRSQTRLSTQSTTTLNNEEDPTYTISRVTASNGNTKIQLSSKNKTRIRNRRLNDSPEGIATIKYDCWSNRHSDSWASANLNSQDDIVKVEILWQGNSEEEYKIKQKELKS